MEDSRWSEVSVFGVLVYRGRSWSCFSHPLPDIPFHVYQIFDFLTHYPYPLLSPRTHSLVSVFISNACIPYQFLKVGGKDEEGMSETNVGLMFPRIHVNDTEKGGPRAPPRNKMALYEQLSIPSRRFSSEEGASERGSFFPHQQTPTMHAVDETNNQYSKSNTQLVKQEQKKKQEHGDFRVPTFAQQSGINLDHRGNHQNKDNETLSPYNLPLSDCLTNVEKSSRGNKIQSKETNGACHKNVSNNNSIRLPCNGNSREHVIDSVVHNIRASENSMVDSISGGGVSPDDVVGLIGQNLFWKARRDIINQQRVFAVQVFELHRLIKVQRLIAGLPQVMTETDTFMKKPIKYSQIKQIPLDYVREWSTNVPKIKDYQDKSKDDKREFLAENVVGKASLSSVNNSNWSTLTRYPLPPPSDPKMGPWSQQNGQQWLIPVMSPTEGLIYKPYPAQPYYQWPTGFQPLVLPPAHGYFPPYGMATMNPSNAEEMNPNPFYNAPSVVYFRGSNNEAQVSAASSPSENTKTRDDIPLFPTHPPAEGPTEPTRAIRVVPRNAMLATESAARIFRSIQQERMQQDPI